MNALITVVLPVYGRAALVEQAVHQLRQWSAQQVLECR